MDITRSRRSDLWATLGGMWLGVSATGTPLMFYLAAWTFMYDDRKRLYVTAMVLWAALHVLANAAFVLHLNRPRLSATLGFVSSLQLGKLLAVYAIRASPHNVRMAFADSEWMYWGQGAVIAASLQLVVHRVVAKRLVTPPSPAEPTS